MIWAPGNPPGLAAAVRDTLAAIAPDLVVRRVESYSEVYGLTTYLSVAGVLLTVATLIAASVPARRAACVDPVQALRLE